MLNYQTIAVDRLTGQFANSPKLRALVSAVVSSLAELEIVADDIKAKRWIDTAEGRQLDGCGAIIGETRRGRDDDAYRVAIKFRVFANTSLATPSDLIQALRFLTDPTDCQYLEMYPATAILFTDGAFVPSTIQGEIQTFAPAGISVIPVAVSYQAKPFRMGRASVGAELFVNDEYLTANTSDISLSGSGVALSGASLGGCVASELEVDGMDLDLGGPTLAVYNPDEVTTLGHYHLPGVYQ